MKMLKSTYTQQVLDRSTSRNIPSGVIELILEYGEHLKAMGDAEKYSLSKSSLRALKRDYGGNIVNAL